MDAGLTIEQEERDEVSGKHERAMRAAGTHALKRYTRLFAYVFLIFCLLFGIAVLLQSNDQTNYFMVAEIFVLAICIWAALFFPVYMLIWSHLKKTVDTRDSIYTIKVKLDQRFWL